MHVLCSLQNENADKGKENSTIWKAVNIVITIYVVTLNTDFFFVQEKKIMKHMQF